MGISTVQICYNDGVNGESCFSPVSLNWGQQLLTTTAVEIQYTGGGTDGYYTLTSNAFSPQTYPYSGLIASTSSTDYYDDFTIVFCIQPKDMGLWDVFVGAGFPFYISFAGATGEMYVGGQDKNNNNWWALTATTSPIGGPCYVDQWAAVMISSYIDRTVSPIQKMVKIMVNGSMVYDGAINGGTGHESNKPQTDASPWRVYAGLGYDVDSTTHYYLSYIWADDTYLDPDTYWSSFFNESNKPYDLGADGSNPTGTQPATYAPNGRLEDNKGYLYDWTENNTVSNAPSSPSD